MVFFERIKLKGINIDNNTLLNNIESIYTSLSSIFSNSHIISETDELFEN